MKIEVIEASDYVAAIPEGRRPHVEAVRKLVRRVVPNSVERSDGEGIRFSYGGKAFAAVSSENAGLGLYLLELSARPELVKKYEDVLGGLDMAKDCIRFQELDELPVDVIADILRETLASGLKASKKAAKPAKKAASAKKPAKKAAKAVQAAEKKPAAKKAGKPAKKAAKAPAKKAAKKPAAKAPATKNKKAKKKSRR